MKIFLFLIVYFFIIAFFVINFNLGYLVSVILYFGVPSLYLSWKKPEMIKKTLFYSLLFSVPMVFIVDYMAHVSEAWYVPSELGIRLAGAFPIDQFLWGFLFFYLIIAIYNNTMVKQYSNKLLTTNIKYLFIAIILFELTFIAIFIFNKELLVINTFYILFIIFIMALPSIINAIFYPKLIKKIIPIAILFLISFLIYEYSALTTGQWFFNGQHYFGWIQFFDVRFPIEEFLYMLFAVPGTIYFYELFSRDNI